MLRSKGDPGLAKNLFCFDFFQIYLSELGWGSSQEIYLPLWGKANDDCVYFTSAYLDG